MEPEIPFVGLTIVDSTMTAGQVALAVLRKHFVAMLAKEPGTLEGSDPEELHDMRVATRRLRAASSLFRQYVHQDVLAFRDEFAWIGGVLGQVRDLDVQLEHIHEWAPNLPGEAEARLAPYRDLLAKRREAARAEMAEALCTDRYNALARDFAALLTHGPLPEEDAPIVVVAPALVEKRMRSFRKAGANLAPDDPVENYHLARIRAKKIRYAMEFVAAVYGKPAKDASMQIVAVQDLLGLHQDCVVAAALVDDIAENERFPGSTMFALGLLRQYLDDRAADLRTGFPPLLKAAHGKEWRAFHETMLRHIPQESAEPEPELEPEPEPGA